MDKPPGMKKRKFIKTASTLVVGAAVSPIMACKAELKDARNAAKDSLKEAVTQGANFELPALLYSFDALAPNIDARTMEIHHGKHHAGYVRKFNAALDGSSMAGKSIEDILADIGPDDSGLRNNGGGHYNHSLFWSVMSPNGGGIPSGDLADAINGTFDSFDSFKEQFSKAAATRFGSGWAWLCQGGDGKLFVCSTPNQDNPMMANISEHQGMPLLGLDVWEHAYYLNYQNRRGDYIANFFNIIDWNAVAARMT